MTTKQLVHFTAGTSSWKAGGGERSISTAHDDHVIQKQSHMGLIIKIYLKNLNSAFILFSNLLSKVLR